MFAIFKLRYLLFLLLVLPSLIKNPKSSLTTFIILGIAIGIGVAIERFNN